MDWFTGSNTYHNLLHCMGGDVLWAALLCGAALAVCGAYAAIVLTFWRASRRAPDSVSRRLLRLLVSIFALCALCGYLSRPVSLWWPGYRLLALLQLALATVAWAFWWGSQAGGADALFRQLARGDDLEELMLRLRDRPHEVLNQLWGASPVGLAWVSSSGAFLRVNRAACELLGRAEAELLGMTFQDVTHPEDLGLDWELWEEVLADRRDGYQIRKRYLRPDGRVVWALLVVSVIRDTDRRVIHSISQVVDLSREVELEHELGAKLERARADLDSLEARRYKPDPSVVSRLEELGEQINGILRERGGSGDA